MDVELNKSVLLWSLRLSHAVFIGPPADEQMGIERVPSSFHPLYFASVSRVNLNRSHSLSRWLFETSDILFFASHNAPDKECRVFRRLRPHWLTSCLAKSSKYSHNSICRMELWLLWPLWQNRFVCSVDCVQVRGMRKSSFCLHTLFSDNIFNIFGKTFPRALCHKKKQKSIITFRSWVHFGLSIN